MSRRYRSPVTIGGLLALALAGVGCTQGASFPPSDMSFEEFCPAWQGAVDAFYARCEGLPPEGVNTEPCASQAARLAAGRVGFDRSRAAGCVRGWQTLSCEGLRKHELVACNTLEWGLVPSDGDCAADIECAGDLYCDFSAGTCPGKCRAGIASGADCSAAPTTCTFGTSCVDNGSGPHCRGWVAAGGACGPAVGDCGLWLACVTAPGGQASSTCQPVLRAGDACVVTNDACPSFAPCGSGGTCALTPVTPVGGPCASDTRCTGGTVCLGGACTDCAGAP